MVSEVISVFVIRVRLWVILCIVLMFGYDAAQWAQSVFCSGGVLVSLSNTLFSAYAAHWLYFVIADSSLQLNHRILLVTITPRSVEAGLVFHGYQFLFATLPVLVCIAVIYYIWAWRWWGFAPLRSHTAWVVLGGMCLITC